MIIGKNIRSFRKLKGLKQVQLAEKADISVSYLCEIENGKTMPSIKTLTKLAKALNVDFASLFAE